MSKKFDPRAHQDGNMADVIPAGEYVFRSVDAEPKRQPQEKLDVGKSDYVNVQLRVVSDGQYKGAQISEMISFSEKALWRLSAFCIGGGCVETFDLDEDDEVRGALVGLVVKATTKIEVYEGKERTRLDTVQTMTVEERAKYTTGNAAPATEASQSFGNNDEIPF